MNIVDSSGWLSYFADEPSAIHFQLPLCETATLVVPVITIYEVSKVLLRESGENEALQAVSAMQKGKVIDLTTKLALAASVLSLQ
ncbi:MAG: type II toxin-antitoxin system VapC family toxin [Chlorobium sp.]